MGDARGHRAEPGRIDSPLSWWEVQRVTSPVVLVPIDALRPAASPRLAGEDRAHVRLIAESDADDLPPITVHKATMRVIDGMHRVRAAALRGATQVRARLYDGDPDDAFVLAVQLNVRHGLPLSLEDRTQAAARIVGSHPHWSDRAIASAVGLSPKTVAAIRVRSAQQARATNRIGRDGRIRPVSTAASRRLAGELMTSNPDASLREIARLVGLAPSTVLDVRSRLRAGLDPVPANQLADPNPKPRARPERRTTHRPTTDRDRALRVLTRDPSLRFSESGRSVLRWLEGHSAALSDWRRVVEHIPEHCSGVIAALAREYAATWSDLADHLDRRLQRTEPALRRSGS
jgi:hypothetical protein